MPRRSELFGMLRDRQPLAVAVALLVVVRLGRLRSAIDDASIATA
jgi:hypothetical protein